MIAPIHPADRWQLVVSSYTPGMITVHLFASLREAVGTSQLEVEPETDLTVRRLLEILCSQHPPLQPYRESVRGAVNQAYAEWDATVADGDEVAFFPPVSGGSK